MKYVCYWLIRFYQKFLSPLKGSPTCRFTPTCSAYAAEAFMKRGFFAGLWLTCYRILRCNPFCRGGYDPVPEKKHKKIPKYQRDSESDEKTNEIKNNDRTPEKRRGEN